jgi:hypothetical protein
VLCTNSSSPTILNCWFDDNGGYGPGPPYGGGMACLEGSSPRLVDCEFYGNSAALGAAIYCEDSSPILEDVEFIDNGGYSGAALYCIGGTPDLLDCRFIGNNAGDSGAAAYFYDCSPTLTHCNFNEQSTGAAGGAIWCGSGLSYCSITMYDCAFCGNDCSYWGGAISCVGGDGLCDLRIVGCTVTDNRAWLGGSGVSLAGNVSCVIENTVIAFNTGSEGISCGEQVVCQLSCSDIYGNEDGDWTGPIASQLGLNGNISADPLFCEPDGFLYCDPRVEDCSPCLPGYHPDGYDCGRVIGAFGSGCACGTPTEPTTWGAIKSIYR